MLKAYRQCKLCNKHFRVWSSLPKRRLTEDHSPANGELEPAYKPHELEKLPFNDNYFTSNPKSNEPPFTLILPPPNITGTLHLGHALTVSIQDVLVKWYKLHGRPTLWVPGMDHAGIATQVVVEKKLWKEQGLTRHDIGREAFELEVLKWRLDKASTIVEQLKRLNVSMDWEREFFTMDPERSEAVIGAFIKLFDEQLIYRADHLVNWSCALRSAISDIEVDHLTIDGPTSIAVPGYKRPVKFGVLVNFAYKLEDSEEEVVVATTRPETILGDSAVAVNPSDSRYSHLVGRRLQHPFRNDSIPIIADDFVDPNFGTGVVKVTPAHDPTDFEVAKRHNLKHHTIIDPEGTITRGNLSGLKRFEARDVVLNLLAERNLFRGSHDHKMTIPICSRSKDVVEFLVRPQWFLKCSEMASRAVEDVRELRLKIEPSAFDKVWFHWLENIKDWCVSRQLWWGHRIPAYLCSAQNSSQKVWVAARSAEEALSKASQLLKCPVEDAVQDEDVLDTWFSSALLPFSAFGWPQNTPDLSGHYPLSLMETGHDILFFWVARMVMLGQKLTGQLPFNKVLLHGVICDVHGRKMSKSLGNVIAPEEVIDGATVEQLKSTLTQNFNNGILSSEELKKALEGQKKMFPQGIPECGADALRFTLLSHNPKNQMINFDVNECHTNKLFCNKIWQATKFTLMWIDKVAQAQPRDQFDSPVTRLSLIDQWIVSRLCWMLRTVKQGVESYDFHVATFALKNFLYYDFCDVYLEAVKTDLKDYAAESAARGHCQTLLRCLDHSLRALSPFMPVLAHHLHSHLPRLWRFGFDTSFPEITDERNEQLERQVSDVMELVSGVRRLKKTFNLTYKYQPEVFLVPLNDDVTRNFTQMIKDLSHVYTLHVQTEVPVVANLVEDRVGDTKIFLVVPPELKENLQLDLVKMEAKRIKLVKELDKLNETVTYPGYLEKNSLEIQERHRKKIQEVTEKISRIDYVHNLTR